MVTEEYYTVLLACLRVWQVLVLAVVNSSTRLSVSTGDPAERHHENFYYPSVKVQRHT